MEKRGKLEKRKNKKAQLLGMPFQFIFALILVAVVLFVGFYVIKMFLDRAEQANINDFVKNQLQYEIENIWQDKTEAEITKTFSFSKNFAYVCFFNQSQGCNLRYADIHNFCQDYVTYKRTDKDNVFLIGKNGEMGMAEKYDTYTAWHVACGSAKKDCFRWQRDNQLNNQLNPLCIPVEKGKVSIKFIKEAGQNYVLISQA